MKQFTINFLIILTLINPEFELHQCLLLAINFVILTVDYYLRYNNYYTNINLKLILQYLKSIILYATLAINCTQQQICVQLILLSNLDSWIKILIAIASSINSILQPNIYKYYVTIPYMILIISKIAYDKWKERQLNQPQTILQQQTNLVTFKQKSIQIDKISSDQQIQSNIIRSPDGEILDLQNSPIAMDLANNEQEEILGQMPWLHNSKILVFNQNIELVYQNFYLGKLTKNNVVTNKEDYDQTFLDSQIEIGSREVNDLFNQSEIDLDQSESLLLESTVHSRYKIKSGQKRIQQMIVSLFENYFKWKFFSFTLYKIKNNELDFSGFNIKVLITEVKTKLYVLFMLEAQQSIFSKKVLDETNQFQNVFQNFLTESNNYVNAIHLLILLSSHDFEKNNGKIPKEYLKQMRMSTLKFMMFLSTIKDLTLAIQNQITFRNSSFKITDILDELQMIYEDSFKIKEISVIPIIDNDIVIINDSERTKQVLKCLLEIAVKFTVQAKIRIDIHQQQSTSNFLFSIKDIPFKDENQKSQYQQLLKNTGKLMKTNCKDFEMSNLLELEVSAMLAYLLSGSLRKPLELIIDNNQMGIFQFSVESINSKQAQTVSQTKGKRPFETSLSMLLAQAQDSSHYKNDESKYLSFTQISKQYSIKQDQPFDLQSAHFSQISKIKQESPQVIAVSSHPSNSVNGTQKFPDSLYPRSFNNPSKVLKSDSALNNESSKPATSALDFGDSTNPNLNLDPMEMSPKFLHSIIKFKLTNQCCAKVLIADNDYFNVHVLQILLNKYEVKSDKSFTYQQSLQMIKNKSNNPCRCKNGSYLIYFIDAYLPSGIDLIKDIKQQFKNLIVDKGFIIAMASYCDMELKMNCFNSGVDYFITKPLDPIELTSIIQYIQF